MIFNDFSYEELVDYLKKENKSVYLYGEYSEVVNFIEKNEEIKISIKGFISPVENHETNLELKLFTEDEITKEKNGLIFFIWNKKHGYRKVVNTLNELKEFSHVEFCVLDLMKYKNNDKLFLEDRHFDSENKILPRILVLLTHKCSLKCKECAMLVPYVENPVHRNLQEIINDIDNFLRGINRLKSIGLTGGEVFMYPQLNKILEYLINQSKIDEIQLLTNGTITPNDSVIKLLKNKKIYVRISDYGQFEKMSNLVILFEKNNIKFDVCTDMKWWSAGDCKKRNKSTYELRTEFMNCGTGDFCKMLLNGKFYGCERAARMDYMNKYSSTNDYVELLNDDNDEEIYNKIKKMYKLQTMDACDYCDLSKFPHKYVKTAE